MKLKNCLLSLNLFFVLLFPNFTDFVNSVRDGTNEPRGVYVNEKMALPIVQQPSGNDTYISENDNELTEFEMVYRFTGNIGLMAHNNLSGKSFSLLSIGDTVRLVYGNGRVEYYMVSEVLEYQLLEPENIHSSLRDLETNKILGVDDVSERVYRGSKRVVFYTCIAKGDEDSWGRLFVIAKEARIIFGVRENNEGGSFIYYVKGLVD